MNEEQCALRKDSSCSDQINVVGKLCEKTKEEKKNEFSSVIDLKQTFDRVDREVMWQVQETCGVG